MTAPTVRFEQFEYLAGVDFTPYGGAEEDEVFMDRDTGNIILTYPGGCLVIALP